MDPVSLKLFLQNALPSSVSKTSGITESISPKSNLIWSKKQIGFQEPVKVPLLIVKGNLSSKKKVL